MTEILPKAYLIELNNIEEELIVSSSKNTLEFDSYVDSLIDQETFNLYSMNLKSYYWKLDKYLPGEKYSSIIDDIRGRPSTVSFKIFVNDDYEGGELTFDSYSYTIKPKKGLLLVHPSSYLYKYSMSPISGNSQIVLSKHFYHPNSKDA